MSAKRGGYRLSPRSRQDLEDIWLYTFRQWSLTQADNYISGLLAACAGLAGGEKVGIQADDIRQGYWKYFSGLHVIYYTASGEYLDVIRILHQSRDVDLAELA